MSPARIVIVVALLSTAAACSASDAGTATTSQADEPTLETATPGSSSATTTSTPSEAALATAPLDTAPPSTVAVESSTTVIATEAVPGRSDLEIGGIELVDLDFPPQLADVPWPTTEWPVGDLPAPVDVSVLDGIVDTAFGPDDNESRVRSVLVVHEGTIVYERYHPLDSAETEFSSFSVAKSATSALTGMVVGDGLLDPAAPAPVAEWRAADDPRSTITLDQLLRMSSGLEWEEGSSDYAGMFASESAASYASERPLESEPGEVFEYSTGTTAIVAGILADQLGGGDALDEYIHQRLLEPLGMNTTMLEDATGTFLGGLGFDSTARDFARFGLLYLRGGMWEGRSLIDERWIEYSITPSITNEQYGAQWWMFRPGTFSADGLFGQKIIVVPDLDLVVVITSNPGGSSDFVATGVLDEFSKLD